MLDAPVLRSRIPSEADTTSAPCPWRAGPRPPGDQLGTTTVTVNEPVAVLPWASVAEQLTHVVPIGKKYDPEAGLQLRVTEPSTRSVAVGAGV